MATVTSVQPPGRYGAIITDSDSITEFTKQDGALINGGFVLSPKTLN